jgi:hypothetical protein
MTQPVLHIFSYLPNPRVAKALIAADFCGVRVETRGDAPAELQGWLWDFDARPLDNAERVESSPHARTSRRGFSGTLFKTDAFLRAHPFGTVPAAFGPEGRVGIFESNSILRAVARAAESTDLYGRDGYEASRIDSFLDASFVCDLGQFLTERRGRKTLDAAGFLPVTNAEPTDHPRAFEHLFRLGALPEFERHLGSLLDHPRKQLGLG